MLPIFLSARVMYLVDSARNLCQRSGSDRRQLARNRPLPADFYSLPGGRILDIPKNGPGGVMIRHG